ncbi:MAG: DUF2125 domain-containing protein [Alphaproteobacteria bacterium]|nr:DUF2125 domain-containing protein [Alphaproteobacteria bacterium]
MSYSNRIFIYLPVGLLLLLVVLYSVYWRVQADTLAARLDAANGGEIVPGIIFTFAEKSVGGYPFRLDTVLSGVTFAHRRMDGETAWRTERLALHAMTYGRPMFLVEADGLQSFARPPLEAGQVPRVIFVTSAQARASVILRDGGLLRFDLDMLRPDGKDASQDADPARTFSAARAQFHLLRRADNTIDVVTRIDGAMLGAGYMPALSGELPLIELKGKLMQAQAFEGLQTRTASVFDATEDWRRSGGALAVENLALNWGPVRTNLTGIIELDDNHNPSGALAGPVDAGGVLGTLLRGMFSGAPDGKILLSLQFKDGDIKVGAGATAPAGAAAPAGSAPAAAAPAIP